MTVYDPNETKATPLEITFDNEWLTDGIIRLYLAGAYEGIKLETIATLFDVPISDLYGALRRAFAANLRPCDLGKRNLRALMDSSK